MTTDYSKKKNAELEELLKSKGLPHTGKKAELVARLQQHDAQQSSNKSSAITDTGGDDEIDWDDDAPTTAAPTKGSDPVDTAAIAAGGVGQVKNPAAVPNQAVDIDPSTTDDLTVREPAPELAAGVELKDHPTDETVKPIEAPSAPPSTNFTSGLSSTSLDDEIARRQKRAARFNLKENDSEALKSLERAKKFGTGTAEDKSAIRGLDEALPERMKKDRGNKRGREENRDGRGDTKRRDGGKRNAGRPTRSNSRSKPDGGRRNRSGGRKQDRGLSEKDRVAAEARKERFSQES